MELVDEINNNIWEEFKINFWEEMSLADFVSCYDIMCGKKQEDDTEHFKERYLLNNIEMKWSKFMNMILNICATKNIIEINKSKFKNMNHGGKKINDIIEDLKKQREEN